jgi:HSP20 family protein
MVVRTDPFRELDRLAQQLFRGTGAGSRPAAIPLDAYRSGDDYVLRFDLPGVAPESIDVQVERNVLTVRAERKAAFGEQDSVQVNERPRGVFRRELFLGESLDTGKVAADYDAGVLTLRIPFAEQATARKITVGSPTPALNA